jgi:hypothetical protein
MGTTDLLTLDRKAALAARAIDGWRAELAIDDRRDRDDPLVGYLELASRATLESIGKSGLDPVSTVPALLLPTGEVSSEPTLTGGGDDPLAALRDGLTRWCAHFHLWRAIRELTALRAAAFRDPRESDAYGREIGMRAMLRALARPKQAGGVPEPRAAATLEDLAPGALDAVADEESARRETAEGVGPSLDCCKRPDKTVAAAAAKWLADSEDEAREHLAFGLRQSGRAAKNPTWVDVLAVRRAADLGDGWPSALSGRWFAELARGTELLAGLSIDVKVDAARLTPRTDQAALRLAPPTGAWSFGHALFALGVALRVHGREAKAPFSTHAPPHDRRPWVMGEAFARLIETPAFHARARGVSAQKAEASARRLAGTRLLERRQLALRVALAPELARNRRVFAEAFEDLAPRALLGETPKELAALLGAPGPTGPADDAGRWLAHDEGVTMHAALVERFDSDWWRNPKAAQWIRGACAR